MKFFRNVENFVFGAECLGCGQASGYLDPWLCPGCAEMLDRESKAVVSPGPDAYSLFPMRPLTRRLVHALKYKGISGMATYLVRHSSVVGGTMGTELALLPRPLKRLLNLLPNWLPSLGSSRMNGPRTGPSWRRLM